MHLNNVEGMANSYNFDLIWVCNVSSDYTCLKTKDFYSTKASLIDFKVSSKLIHQSTLFDTLKQFFLSAKGKKEIVVN